MTRLEAEGQSVAGLDLRPEHPATVQADISDAVQVRRVFERLKPRRVVHTAAIVDDRGAASLFEAVNVRGTAHVIDACEALGVERLVHVSSIVVLGLDSPASCDENTPLQAYTGAPYMDTKALSERMVRDAWAMGRLPALVIRPGDVYGPASEPWVRRPLEMMRKGLPVLVGRGRGLMVHCWITNLVDALVLALHKGSVEGCVFHVTDGVEDTTFKTYFERLARAGGTRLSPVSLPGGMASRLGDGLELISRYAPISPPFTGTAVRYMLRRSAYSIAPAKALLGYHPEVDLDEGMAQLARAL